MFERQYLNINTLNHRKKPKISKAYKKILLQTLHLILTIISIVEKNNPSSIKVEMFLIRKF